MAEISQTDMYIIWAAATVVFGIFEGLTAQLVSIWFMLGAAAALIAALFGAGLTVQIIVFAAVTFLTLVITRPVVKKYIRPKKEHTNADRVINQIGIVTEEINNLSSLGQVKADGKEWTARSADGSIIPKGERVIIEKIEGVKLIVRNNSN